MERTKRALELLVAIIVNIAPIIIPTIFFLFLINITSGYKNEGAFVPTFQIIIRIGSFVMIGLMVFFAGRSSYYLFRYSQNGNSPWELLKIWNQEAKVREIEKKYGTTSDDVGYLQGENLELKEKLMKLEKENKENKKDASYYKDRARFWYWMNWWK